LDRPPFASRALALKAIMPTKITPAEETTVEVLKSQGAGAAATALGIARNGEIPISSLNPDADGDGQVSHFEKQIYERLVAADADKTGFISVRNLFDLIQNMQDEVREAKAGISIKSLNPDTDGDGKVEKWESEVYERIKDADEDKSGSISVKELFGVIKGAAESDKQKRLFMRLFGVAVVVILALIGCMLGMGIVAGEAIKESHVKSNGRGSVMTSVNGDLVTVGQAMEAHTIWDMPYYTTQQLGQVTFMDIAVDMNTNPDVNDWTAAAFRPTGMYFKGTDELVLTTPEAYEMHINGQTQTGYIKMGTNTFPISNQVPQARVRRFLQEHNMAELSPSFPAKKKEPKL